MVTIYPDQRVPISEKMNEDWYINNIHYWIDLAMACNDKKKTLDNVDAANGIITEDMYAYALNPLSAHGDKVKNLPGVIRDVDFITPIREKNLGEYIELPHQALVRVNDPDISLNRNYDLSQQIKPVIEQHIINLLNQQQDTGVPSKETPDVEEEIKKMTEEWFDERGINAQHLINWISDNNNYNDFRIEAFNDWWCTEEVYMRSWIQGGDVMFEGIDPLHGYPIDNGYEFIHDNDAFMSRRTISINRIHEYYQEDLTDKDYKYLQELLRTNESSGYYADVELIENIYGRKVFGSDGNRSRRSEKILFADSTDVWEHVVYWKTQVKRRILRNVNELGQITTRVVDSSYKLNENEGDIAIDIKWIDEVWTQVLLGNHYSGIYLKPKAYPVQIYDAKGHVRLPVTGKKGLLRGLYMNPIPRRIAPNQALFRVITLQIERQMAKYKGSIEVIPQSMLLGGEDADPKAAYFYRLADNTIIYDDTQISAQEVATGYRMVGNDTVSAYIRTLIDLRESVKQEAWEMANMNDSRFGLAAPSSTVTNNQQNIFRAKLGSILMVTTFNSVLIKLHEMNLELSKIAFADGVSGGYFDTTGSIHHFNINSHELSNTQYGFAITNSVLEKEKLDEYKRMAFSAAQNGDFQLASKALESDNVSEIRTYVKDFMEAREEFERGMKEREQQVAEQQIAANEKRFEREHEQKLEEITVEQNLITDRELKKAAMVSSTAIATSNKDSNK